MCAYGDQVQALAEKVQEVLELAEGEATLPVVRRLQELKRALNDMADEMNEEPGCI